MDFDNLYNYYLYCQYKDYEGIYCDACRRQIIFNEISKYEPIRETKTKFVACPDCIKERNGNGSGVDSGSGCYPYLSDFSIFDKGFNEIKNYGTKMDIMRLFGRSDINPVLAAMTRSFKGFKEERFIKRYIDERDILGCALSKYKYEFGDLVFKKNKFKHIPNAIIASKYKNVIVGKLVRVKLLSGINHKLIRVIQRIVQFQHEKPVMKYIVTKQFGSIEQKIKLYNHYKQSGKFFGNVSFENFWDDYGLYYLMSVEDSIFSDPIIDSIEDQSEFVLLHLYDYSLHWSERAQRFFEWKFYGPKKYNFHKLGYF